MRSLLSTLLLAIVALLPQAAQAQDSYFGVATLYNKTGFTVNYSVRRNSPGEPWWNYSLAPGEGRNHVWRYSFPNENRSPQLVIAFDGDLTDEVRMETMSVISYRSPTADESVSKHYNFLLNGTELVLIASPTKTGARNWSSPSTATSPTSRFPSTTTFWVKPNKGT